MDYRVARILRVLIYIFVGLLCLLVLWVGFQGIKGVLNPAPTTDVPQAINLNDSVNKGAQLQYVIDGPIVAPENHTQITITISPTSRVVNVVQGYNVAPIKSQTFANNQASYDAFASAINNSGFTLVKEPQSDASRTGSCSLGNKFSYQVVSGGSLAQDSWNNSCNTKQGTFAGNTSLVSQLFQSQIPNYGEVTTVTQ